MGLMLNDKLGSIFIHERGQFLCVFSFIQWLLIKVYLTHSAISVLNF